VLRCAAHSLRVGDITTTFSHLKIIRRDHHSERVRADFARLAALGGQQTPPNTVMVNLAMFLTAFVMAPIFQKSHEDGIQPLMVEQISEGAFARAAAAEAHTDFTRL
jgi:hypothetical protein